MKPSSIALITAAHAVMFAILWAADPLRAAMPTLFSWVAWVAALWISSCKTVIEMLSRNIAIRLFILAVFSVPYVTQGPKLVSTVYWLPPLIAFAVVFTEMAVRIRRYGEGFRRD